MGRSDLAKLLQSGSSLNCSEVAFSGTTKPFSIFDFWRQGLPKPSEGVTLPSRVRLTPRGVASPKAMMLQTGFRATLFGTVLFESNHESLHFVSSPSDFQSLTFGDGVS